MRALLHRLARDERGVALVMALIIMAALAGTTAALVLPGAVNQRNSLKSADARQAFALAETALAYGEGAVYQMGTTGKRPSALSPNTAQPIPTQAGMAVGDSGKWYATVAPDGITWTIYATGTVDGVARTVHAQATDPTTKLVTDSGVWNYVYADAAGTTCASSWNGSVTVSVPIMVRGDLCISGSLNFTGSQLQVGGNLSVTGSAKIGSAGAKINSLEIGLDSNSTSTCNSVAPGTGVCDGSQSPIYATSVVKGMSVTPLMPCIGQPSSWDSQCAIPNQDGTSNDGTWWKLHSYYDTQAGLTKTGCPANLFDNDSTLNNSDTSISSVMFGNTDYDCKVGTNEIRWDHTANTLYVAGALYFDGSLTINGSIVYSGQASLYFTGGVSMGNNSSFCGISACTGSWNPDANGVVFVAGCWANSTGSTLTTSGCVNLSGGATAQFGVYCTTDYQTAGGSSNMGPVLANTLNIGGNTASLIPFHYMPPGTPVSTRFVTVPGSPPTNWSG